MIIKNVTIYSGDNYSSELGMEQRQWQSENCFPSFGSWNIILDYYKQRHISNKIKVIWNINWAHTMCSGIRDKVTNDTASSMRFTSIHQQILMIN